MNTYSARIQTKYVTISKTFKGENVIEVQEQMDKDEDFSKVLEGLENKLDEPLRVTITNCFDNKDRLVMEYKASELPPRASY